MDWSKGFSSAYYATFVDKASWRDVDKFDLISGNINRSVSSLIEAAELDTREAFDNERWIRVYMDTRQNGETGHEALFTGLAVPPKTEIDGNIKTFSLECYSVLKPAEDVLLDRGYYIPKGINGGEMIAELLKVTPAPVEIDALTPNLRNVIVAESGETHLSMVYKILKAINRRIRISGDGTIHIAPTSTEAAVAFSALDYDAVEPKLTLTHDWFSCPNVFRVTDGDTSAIARDEREDSILSVQNRGREVWMAEDSVYLADDEGLAEYADRRLKEEQARAYDASYSRRYHPDIRVTDYVTLRYPAQGLDGTYKVVSQRIELGYGCRTEETIEYS